MRSRTSAALALVMALLASPVAAFACGFECSPASSPFVAATSVEAPPAEASCHRQLEDPIADGPRFTATPHDCSTHAPLIPRLTHPKTAASPAPGTGVTLLSPANRLALSTLVARVTTPPSRDLSPPGRTPDLIAPLRI